MKTNDPEAFCDQDVEFVQQSTDLLVTRSTENRTDPYFGEPITMLRQVDVVVNWETARREAQKVANTPFFQDLMTNLVALRRHRASLFCGDQHVPCLQRCDASQAR